MSSLFHSKVSQRHFGRRSSKSIDKHTSRGGDISCCSRSDQFSAERQESEDFEGGGEVRPQPGTDEHYFYSCKVLGFSYDLRRWQGGGGGGEMTAPTLQGSLVQSSPPPPPPPPLWPQVIKNRGRGLKKERIVSLPGFQSVTWALFGVESGAAEPRVTWRTGRRTSDVSQCHMTRGVFTRYMEEQISSYMFTWRLHQHTPIHMKSDSFQGECHSLQTFSGGGQRSGGSLLPPCDTLAEIHDRAKVVKTHGLLSTQSRGQDTGFYLVHWEYIYWWRFSHNINVKHLFLF